MLDRGFIDDLRALVSQLSKDCQVNQEEKASEPKKTESSTMHTHTHRLPFFRPLSNRKISN